MFGLLFAQRFDTYLGQARTQLARAVPRDRQRQTAAELGTRYRASTFRSTERETVNAAFHAGMPQSAQ